VQSLFRELRQVDSPQGPRIEIDGKTYLNFSSNDYLGLANEAALKEAAVRTVEKFGTGSGASRLVCGSLAPHVELEEALAAFKGTDAALSFSSGYATAIGTICALVGKDDILVVDKLCHASIIDAARLSGAKLRILAHNDLNDLEEILRWAHQRLSAVSSVAQSRPNILIVTESVFSMDGDLAPLPEIIDLKDRYSAWLMVDDAHATGLYGANRRGLAEACGISERIEIQMGTLGKALGAAGGYICGSRRLIDFLINRARSFIFSTAPVPSAAAAATAGIDFVRSAAGAERCAWLWDRVGEFKAATWPNSSDFSDANSNDAVRRAPANGSAIMPLMIGDESKAMEAAAALRTEGIFIPAIRYPTVARGAARLRLALTGTHTSEDVQQLVAALKRLCLIPHSAMRLPPPKNE